MITENLDKLTGAKSESYVTFKDLFKNTFKKHSQEDLDDVFVCGSAKTTPRLQDINPHNVSAWVYLKMFIFFLIAYIPLRIGYISYGNTNFLPGLIIIGAFAMPVTVLIFFFEINVFRNVPFYKVMQDFIWGGALSLIFAILLFSLNLNTDISTFIGALMVGVIEEVAKAVIVAIFLFRDNKCKYILNGLLIGAAVGAGFAAFETAGYILRYGLNGGVETMLRELGRRLNLNKVHPHKFRRTLATSAIDKGMPIEQVQQLLGHQKIDTTMHYAMVKQQNVKLAHRKFIG